MVLSFLRIEYQFVLNSWMVSSSSLRNSFYTDWNESCLCWWAHLLLVWGPHQTLWHILSTSAMDYLSDTIYDHWWAV